MPAWPSMGVWFFCALAIVGIVARPWRVPEWLWASAAALGVVAIGAVPLADAGHAVARGADVYAFLIGIMLLAEIARHERVFDWFAARLLVAARGSQRRLLLLVYGLGVAVTALLSNDTTAIVLTPAVIAALVRTDADPMPYLYACAFVANAASFVLPISNPANLVVFGRALPALAPWVGAFGLAAVASIVLTYVALRGCIAAALRAPFKARADTAPPRRMSRLAAAVIALAALALVVVATMGWNVGYAAVVLGCIATAIVGLRDTGSFPTIVRGVAWQVVPLVAGLFVVVQGLESAGAIDAARHLLAAAAHLGFVRGSLTLALVVTIATNLFNNLPVALASGFALQSMHAPDSLAHATLVAVDLGPNLSVTGSLATLLWLIVLRRSDIEVTALEFLRLGVAVTLPALAAAVLLVR